MPHPADRGRLRVYLGAAPGVGKTYAMLDEGRRRVERGTDLVVGYVETHGRAKTERGLEGLEVVPRAKVAYRGTVQEEMDLKAILARDPHVVLVDELAHTNVPGSVHEKRWQDVEALLDAGIEVITTVNIQHLESLNDVTEQITGVRQRETVPDQVVRSADQIELVDMSPQALRRRMAHGNIYTADKIDAALSRYFREGNLTALRELALLWLADRVDEGLERYREQHEIDSTWATRERIVVPVSGGPESSTLMRRAARIASRRSGGEWQALYVTRQDGLTGIAPDQLTRLAAKADELGGTFHTVVGDDPADAVLAFARAENATQIVIGASRRGRVSTLLRPGVGERVVTGSGDIDVHIVTHDYVGRAQLQPAADTLGRRRRLIGLAFGVLAPALLSLVLHQTKDLHGLPIEAMSLMVVVVATALIGGIAAAVVSALVSALLLNYLFTPPLYTLTIAEPENAVTIALFVAVGIAVATVVDTAARRTAQARAARAEADALMVLAHSLLTSSDDTDGLLSSACRLFNASGAAVVRRDEAGAEEVVASCGTPPVSVDRADMAAAIDDRNTLVLAGATLPASERGLLNAYAAYAKVMEERRVATGAELERLRLTELDRTRTALLAAVSHDLRNPLAAMKVSVDSLRSTDVTWSPEDEDELLATIEESTDRLTALVTNLLDMSRISTGSVRVVLRDVGLADAVRTSIAPLPGGERIEVDVDPELLVLADAGLLDRVLANICENALKYTPVDARVRIDAAADGEGVVVRIADSGPGVADQDRDRLFAPFQRFGDVPQQDGVGLGLAVAHGLTEAMSGTIATEETPGGGLTFVLELKRGKGGLMTFVLVVDDDPAMRRTLSINLRARDYEVETAGDGRSALQVVDERMPDLVLLDLGLPDLDGVAVLTQLRSFTQVPVIVVSARTESDDKVEALDLGADDFITKPFSIEELLARIRATSRRAGREEPDLVVQAAGLRLDLTDSRATRDGEEVHLTPTEWRIVDVLARRRGRLVRQAELLTAVWGPAYDTQTNYLRVHMASIRRKLEADPGRPVLFLTEPGMGYRFTAGG